MVTVPRFKVQEQLFLNDRTRIVRAIREDDGQSVILKQLSQEHPDSGQLSRFSFSFDVLRKFDHPNIMGAIEWIKGDAKPTMVLEDIHGIDLLHFLERLPDKRLPLDVFFTISVQLSDALSVIHHEQVIHKDLHPGNIIINPDSLQLQIIDFGMSSLLSREQPALEAPEKIEGLLEYISPEQTGRMNRALDYRTDFYTLGVVFYQLLVGERPFNEPDALGFVHAHIAKEQTPVSERRSDVPRVLSNIVDKLLNKTAEERYQSALGLSQDLKRCQRALASQNSIVNFPLGLDDVSDRFQVPQRLYGRQREIKLLMTQFFAAASGQPKMLAIGGYSGIGKSALVHEVHKPIAAQHGLFIAGKFDQFQKNIPYSAFQQALYEWLQHVLSLSDQKLEKQRSLILDELGSNARVLIDFMSDFSLVLGQLAPVAELGADETKNRFHTVFRRFIQIITNARPLVIFIDDIQWADRGTLDLLPLLLSEENCRLLVVVAYRSNEVDKQHPAMETLSAISQAKYSAGELSRINLDPLEINDVKDILQDALFRPRGEVAKLAELVHRKTGGNPFFLGEFLKALYTEGLLDFDLEQQRWCWKVSDIEAKGITDNVVDLMLEKMAKLPSETQALIQLAACVGSRFDLDMLALVSGRRLIEITRLIWPALKQGVLLQDGGDWFLGMVHQSQQASAYIGDGGLLMSESSPLSPHCRFLHDRMLQAAYQSMPLKERQRAHLQIGRIMLSHQGNVEFVQPLFDVVEQLNLGRPLITDETEKFRLLQLNLEAALQAKAASVWHAAADFSDVGIELLAVNAWQEHYDLARDLYRIKAECEYLNGHPDVAETYYQVLFQHLNESLLKAEIFSARVTQAIGRGQWEQGKAYARIGLAALGEELPASDESIRKALIEERAKLEENLDQNKKLGGIQALPPVEDQGSLIALQIYPELAVIGWLLNDPDFCDFCTIKAVNLTLKRGQADLTANILACYAKYLREHHQYSSAVEVAKSARELAEAYDHCQKKANCYNILGLLVWNMCGPISECISLHEEGVRTGLENGEIARSAINRSNILLAELCQSVPLYQLNERVNATLHVLSKNAVFQPPAGFVKAICNTLLGEGGKGADALNDEFIPQLDQVNGSLHHMVLISCRMVLAFWCGDEEGVLAHPKTFRTYWNGVEGAVIKLDSLFVFALSSLHYWHELCEEDKQHYAFCYEQIEGLAEVNPLNYQHKMLLLKAEKARLDKDDVGIVAALYRNAIESCARSGFIQFQALANEYFSLFWYEHNVTPVAKQYLNESLQLYTLWGCQVKVEQLQRRYSDLIKVEEETITRSVLTQTVSFASRPSLDMASVMNSVHLISQELDVTALPSKVLSVIMEIVGATSGVLVKRDSEAARIEAYCDESGCLTCAEQSVELIEFPSIPLKLVEQVFESKDAVNIGDINSNNLVANDPYVLSKQPRSILCVPILQRNQPTGLIYLEHNGLHKAFSALHLDMVRLLLAQATITSENARLFSEVKSLNLSLEDEVELRTRDLALAVKDLTNINNGLNSFSYSVSHDLNAPLRHLKSFAQILSDDYGARLDETAENLLSRVIKNSHKMGELIEGLLELSRMQRHELSLETVDLTAIVVELFHEMKERFPEQAVSTDYSENCWVQADARMLYSVMENLINNAWKYSSKTENAKVEFGVTTPKSLGGLAGVGLVPSGLPEGGKIYYVKDNGAGFDMSHASKLFTTFNRLHSDRQFEGTGIGLSTVKRIIEKHGGYLWAKAHVGQGATFFFTLP